MNNDSVLVLGSKQGSSLPDVKVKMIYCANASALKAQEYNKKYPNIPLVCCTTAKEYSRNTFVKESIINSQPNRIVVRAGTIEKSKNLKNCKFEFLSIFEQRKMQYDFYIFGRISSYLGELYYRKESLKKTLLYFYYTFSNNVFLGSSTGLFAIFLALKENLNSNIIISGIGLSGGPQFYKSDRKVDQDHSPRARVDKFLINSIKNKFKKRIITLDKDMSEGANIPLWNDKVI